mgnify:CR=1 FL=1
MQVELSDVHVQSLLNVLDFGIRNDTKEKNQSAKLTTDLDAAIAMMNEIKAVLVSAKEMQVKPESAVVQPEIVA